VFQSGKEAVRTLVQIGFADGHTEIVSVRMGLTSKLNDTLNAPDIFLDVVNAAGKQYFLAKSAIVSVELVEVPKATHLNMQRRATDRDRFDPFQVLGVGQQAGAEEIRQAYHAMVKTYHPDRFGGIDMPKEMRDYAAAMLVRINLAFEQIGS
jgi:hypothetical protein